MKPVLIDLLQEIYDLYVQGKAYYCGYDSHLEEDRLLIQNLKYLKDKGLITLNLAIRAFDAQITTDGIDLVDAQFVEQSSVQQITNTTNFNIGNVNAPSNIGNQQNASITYGADIESLRDLITKTSVEEQIILNDLMDSIQRLMDSNQPLPKGFAARALNAISNNPILNPVFTSLILKYLGCA